MFEKTAIKKSLDFNMRKLQRIINFVNLKLSFNRFSERLGKKFLYVIKALCTRENGFLEMLLSIINHPFQAIIKICRQILFTTRKTRSKFFSSHFAMLQRILCRSPGSQHFVGTCACQGLRNVCFSENLAYFGFL